MGRPAGAIDLTTEPSSPGPRADVLDATELPDELEPSAPDTADDEHKARIHAALFEDRPLPPEHLGRFVLRGPLGRGGMGTVLEAYDASLDREVALKVLHPTLARPHARRLVREARALAKLSHPNVVQVYDVGEAEGRTFIAMELVRGQTLREWQERLPRPGWRACVRAYLQAGQGLAAAHAAGLVHRDFKPSNCIIDDDGRVRVLDFGLVRALEDGADDEVSSTGRPRGARDERLADSLTNTGVVLGTAAYMPLEQLEGRPVDARGDQFSFCAALYEALHGERPFACESLDELMAAVASDVVRPPPPGTRVPKSLRRALLRGLLADPARRWPSMAALLTELRHVVAPRIQVVSKGVKLLALSLFWVSLSLGAVSALWFPVAQVRGRAVLDGTSWFMLHSIFVALVSAAMFRHIAKLAALYEQGQLFSSVNVRRLRAIGWLVTLLSFGLTLDPEQPGAVALDFHPSATVAGLLFIFVSWVMDEARRLG